MKTGFVQREERGGVGAKGWIPTIPQVANFLLPPRHLEAPPEPLHRQWTSQVPGVDHECSGQRPRFEQEHPQLVSNSSVVGQQKQTHVGWRAWLGPMCGVQRDDLIRLAPPLTTHPVEVSWPSPSAYSPARTLSSSAPGSLPSVQPL